MELNGKAMAIIKANNDYFEYCSNINQKFGCSFPSGALLATAEFQLRYKITTIAGTPASMFNKDGTLNKRKLDSKRRKELRNGAIIAGPNLKGESK